MYSVLVINDIPAIRLQGIVICKFYDYYYCYFVNFYFFPSLIEILFPINAGREPSNQADSS